MARTWVDGMDVLAVRETLKEAVERARKNSAPTLIEARTYRFMGHSMSDPSHGHYRTKSEVEEQRRHDPIKQFSAALEANGIVNQEYLDELDQKVRATVEEAVEFAERSPAPDPKEINTNVYAD
jgi:pyruvate dehydrogenase E1 component alpha subunit